jgi:acetylglutamate kinase
MRKHASPAPLVVKLGGSLLEDPTRRRASLLAVAQHWSASGLLVVVHGGGKKLDVQLAALGIARRIHDGLRITDAATLESAVGVLAGIVNKSVVAGLRELGVPAAGLCGVDGGTLVAERRMPIDGVDFGFVGAQARGHAALPRAILAAGMLPVIAPIAAGRDGGLLNVNADEAAAAIAAALGARRLVFFTDVEGVRDTSGRTLARLATREAESLLSGTGVEGGMRPKLFACLAALRSGVEEIVIAGPKRHAAVLRGEEGGTCLVAA